MIIKKRTVFVCLCASILMLTVLAFTGCGGTDTEPSGKSTAGQTGAEEKVYSLGEAAKTDELEITITRVEKASEWTKTPPEGYEYAVVFIRAKNISDEAQA